MKRFYTFDEASKELECGKVTLMKLTSHLGIKLKQDGKKLVMTKISVERLDEFLSSRRSLHGYPLV